MQVGLIGWMCSGVQVGGRYSTFEVAIERGLTTMFEVFET